eukprot:7383023-Prymnesium_polylepis.1
MPTLDTEPLRSDKPALRSTRPPLASSAAGASTSITSADMAAAAPEAAAFTSPVTPSSSLTCKAHLLRKPSTALASSSPLIAPSTVPIMVVALTSAVATRVVVFSTCSSVA